MSLLHSLKAMLTPAPRLAATEAAARVRAGTALLVDVREPAEWASGIANGATLLSLSDLAGARNQWQTFLAGVEGREVICYCAAGARAGKVVAILTAEGFKAENAGGLSNLQSAGWPITKPAL